MMRYIVQVQYAAGMQTCCPGSKSSVAALEALLGRVSAAATSRLSGAADDFTKGLAGDPVLWAATKAGGLSRQSMVDHAGPNMGPSFSWRAERGVANCKSKLHALISDLTRTLGNACMMLQA